MFLIAVLCSQQGHPRSVNSNGEACLRAKVSGLLEPDEQLTHFNRPLLRPIAKALKAEVLARGHTGE